VKAKRNNTFFTGTASIANEQEENGKDKRTGKLVG